MVPGLADGGYNGGVSFRSLKYPDWYLLCSGSSVMVMSEGDWGSEILNFKPKNFRQ